MIPITQQDINNIVEQNFQVEDKDRKIEVKNIKIKEPPPLSPKELKNHTIHEKTDDVRVTATFKLIDKKKGKVIDERNLTLVKLPRKNTLFNNYMVKGSYYNLVNTLRLAPGIYAHVRKDGKVESRFNLANKYNFRIIADHDGVFYAVAKKRSLLYPILHVMGLTDEAIKKVWGEKVFDINVRKSKGKLEREVIKFAKDLTHKNVKDFNKAVMLIHEYFKDGKMDPEVNKVTIGAPINTTTPQAFLLATKSLIKLYNGEKDPDDRTSLVYKRLYNDEDYYKERLAKALQEYSRQLSSKLQKGDSLSKIYNSNKITESFGKLFNMNLSTYTAQTNPLTMIDQDRLVTILAEGAIGDPNAITVEDRNVNPSLIGIIDPVKTPESSKVGINTFLAMGAEKGKDNKIYQKVYDVKAKKYVKVDHITLYNSPKAFADQYDIKKQGTSQTFKPKSNYITIFEKDKQYKGSPDKVRYILLPATLFTPSTLMVPFLNHNQPNRLLTSAKMATQAVQLENPEPPLVRATMHGIDLDKFFSDSFSIKSNVSGTVIEVNEDKEYIKIKPDKGAKNIKLDFVKEMPVNEHEVIEYVPKVKVGQKVRPGDILVTTKFTKDNTLALGTNLKSAYAVNMGYNFEDGIVISETAAKKLASTHVYPFKINLSEKITDLQKVKDLFPALFTDHSSEHLDSDGIVKKGSSVKPGEYLAVILKDMKDKDPALETFLKINPNFKLRYRPETIIWKKNVTGKVIDVVKTDKFIEIHVKALEPAVVGDKLSGRFGNKGVISRVLPDDEMPKDSKGEPVEIILNPMGVPSRMNVGQVAEAAAGKLADKVGKPYVVPNDETAKSKAETLIKALKQYGLTHKETVTYKGVKIPNVAVGKSYIYKLRHKADKKMGARGIRGPYDSFGEPAQGGEDSGRRIDQLTLYGLMAHGTPHLLEEFRKYKSVNDADLIKALESGLPLPTHVEDSSLDHFKVLLRGLGADLKVKHNGAVSLIPFTDKQIDKVADGRTIKEPKLVNAKNLTPEIGGLFDEKLTGGVEGNKWSKIELPVPVINPMFEPALRAIIGKEAYKNITEGKWYVDKRGKIIYEKQSGAVTGEKGVERLLEHYDIKKEYNNVERLLRSEHFDKLPAQQKDELLSKYRYLNGITRKNINLKDYIMTKVPVVPPKYRPVYLGDKDGRKELNVSDLNYLYRDLIVELQNYEEARQNKAPDSVLADKERNIQGLVKALMVTGSPLGANKQYSSIMKTLIGTTPKSGAIQRKIIGRRQNFSGGAVITNAPHLNVDTIELPEDMAWKMYEPLVLGEMVKRGVASSVTEARDMYERRTATARQFLENVVASRPVLINRSPTLHKFGIMAFNAKLTKRKSIGFPSLVMKGFNADIDGDTVHVHIPITEQGAEEARKMYPSKNLFNYGKNDLMLSLSHEMQIGVYLLTKDNPKGKEIKINSYNELHKLMLDGKIKPYQKVYLAGVGSGSAGRVLVNYHLPKAERDLNAVWDKSYTKKKLKKLALNYKEIYAKIVDSLKELGNEFSTFLGYTIGIEDLSEFKPIKEKVFAALDRKEREILSNKKLTEEEKQKKIIDLYKNADQKLIDALLKFKNNNIVMSYLSGARTSKDQLKQVMISPILVQDVKGRIIPNPIKHSYGEGLNYSELFSTFYGARKGVVDKVHQVQEPGAFTKKLMATSINKVITTKDCGTHNGVEVNITNDFDAKYALNRFLATSIKDNKGKTLYKHNDKVTPEMLKILKKNNIKSIKVRHVSTCQAPNGVCAMCYGAFMDGSIPSVGTNIGVITAETLGEPLTQMTMKTFHTGGVAGSKTGGVTTGFMTLKTLLTMPKESTDLATLSNIEGIVSNIEKTLTGYKITITDKNKKDNYFYVEYPQKPKVKKGDFIKKGQELSTGLVTPNKAIEAQVRDEGYDEKTINELVDLLLKEKKEFVKRLDAQYSGQGINIDSRMYDILADALINQVEVVKSNRPDILPGDMMSLAEALKAYKGEQTIRVAEAKDKILAHKLLEYNAGHKLTDNDIKMITTRLGNINVNVKSENKGNFVVKPVIKGINLAPHMINDWMTRLNYNNLKKVLSEAATQDEEAYYNDYAPIPSWIVNRVHDNVAFKNVKFNRGNDVSNQAGNK